MFKYSQPKYKPNLKFIYNTLVTIHTLFFFYQMCFMYNHDYLIYFLVCININ